jgi:prepilin signal peptidase PulO-like enzyme (type II secretory pathway)
MQSALPFGTFLAAGALTAAVVGDRLVGWYVSLY